MTLLVEDGTRVAGAESYASIATISAYADARGLAFPIGTAPEILAAEQAARRATAWLDGVYRNQYPGIRQYWRTSPTPQSLEWPRIYAYDTTGVYIAINTVPPEVVQATCEAAVRELASPGSLSPDLERGGAIQSLKAGSVEIVYASNALATTTFRTIDGILSGLLGSSAGFSATAMRG